MQNIIPIIIINSNKLLLVLGQILIYFDIIFMVIKHKMAMIVVKSSEYSLCKI